MLPLGLVLAISADESRWASTIMLQRLNRAGEAATAEHGWLRVRVFDDFAAHGYCSAERWVDTFGDSLAQQGDENGTLHPNPTGHARSYGPRTAAAIATALRVPGQ